MKKRADGRYQLKVTLPGGEVKFVYGRTQKEVKEKKEALLMMYGRGVTNTRTITLEEWAHIWWENVKKGKTGHSSQVMYRLTLNNYIIPALGNFKIQDIRAVHIQKFMNDIHKSKDFQQKILTTLNGILEYAVKNNIIYGNPAQYVETHGETHKRQALTTTQKQELLEACENMPCKMIIHLGLFLGLRKAEIIALHWTDFDLSAQTVHIQRAVEFIGNQPHEKPPKTASGDRIIPVPDRLWRELQKMEKRSVFVVTKKDGGQLTQTAYHNMLAQLTPKLSFPLTLHMLRHTYATMLDLAGVPPKTCQYLLGHATLNMTKDVYTHIQAEHLEYAKAKLTTF